MRDFCSWRVLFECCVQRRLQTIAQRALMKASLYIWFYNGQFIWVVNVNSPSLALNTLLLFMSLLCECSVQECCCCCCCKCSMVRYTRIVCFSVRLQAWIQHDTVAQRGKIGLSTKEDKTKRGKAAKIVSSSSPTTRTCRCAPSEPFWVYCGQSTRWTCLEANLAMAIYSPATWKNKR